MCRGPHLRIACCESRECHSCLEYCPETLLEAADTSSRYHQARYLKTDTVNYLLPSETHIITEVLTSSFQPLDFRRYMASRSTGNLSRIVQFDLLVHRPRNELEFFSNGQLSSSRVHRFLITSPDHAHVIANVCHRHRIDNQSAVVRVNLDARILVLRLEISTNHPAFLASRIFFSYLKRASIQLPVDRRHRKFVAFIFAFKDGRCAFLGVQGRRMILDRRWL